MFDDVPDTLVGHEGKGRSSVCCCAWGRRTAVVALVLVGVVVVAVAVAVAVAVVVAPISTHCPAKYDSPVVGIVPDS